MKPRQLSLLVLILGLCSMALSEFSILGPICAAAAIIVGIFADRKVCKEKRDKNMVHLGFLAAFFGITSFIMMLILARSITPEQLQELQEAATQSATEAITQQ
ncbi:MAG: hypothetical protein ACI4OJ_00935 [Lachnospiraceae bacterium]